MDRSSNCEDYRLGSVLKLLFLIPEQEIELALSISHDTGMPLGSVLIAQGKLKSHELRISIHAQSLLKDSLVDTDEINLAVRHLKEQPLGIEGALNMIGWYRNLEQPSNRLGELLIKAGVLTPLQLTKALAQQRSTLEPLGQALTRLSFISKKAVMKVLSIQEVIRSGLLDRVNGVELIQHVCSKYKSPVKSAQMGPDFVETLINMPSRGAHNLLRSVDHLIDSTSKVLAPSSGSDDEPGSRQLFKRFEKTIEASYGASKSQRENLTESNRLALIPKRTNTKVEKKTISDLRRACTRKYGKWSQANSNFKQQIIEVRKVCMNATGSLKLIGPLW